MNADRSLLALVAANHRLATQTEVASAGLSPAQWRRRCEAGTWSQVAPRVWSHEAAVVTWEMRLRAGMLFLGEDAAVAGRSAAAWWGFDGFAPDIAEFLVPRRRRAARWIHVHTTRAWSKGDLLVRNGLRVTSATRTIIDLAAWGATARELERSIDSAVRLRLTAIPKLLERIDDLAGRGVRGIPRLRELLLDSGGESALERRFLRLVRSAGLPRPECQVVHRRDGKRVMRVDFQFSAERLVVEVSGRVGHASDRDRQTDARRRNALLRQGWKVREFTTADVVDDPEYVLDTVHAALLGDR